MNNWTKIESEKDLPRVSKAEIYKEVNYHVVMEKDNIVYWNTLKLHELYSYYRQGLISHYDPIIKPEAPKKETILNKFK